jgi:hypothetical protein
MSYRLLAQMWGHVGEALDAVLSAKEISLTTMIERRNQLRMNSGGVAARVRAYNAFNGGAGTAFDELAKLDAAIPELQRQIKTLGARYKADGTVLQGRRTQMVQYDWTLEQQDLTRAYIGQIPGRMGPFSPLLRRKDGSLIDTTGWENALSDDIGRGIYVMSAQGNFYIAEQKMWKRHHSSFLAGGHIACGGELTVLNGRITYINNNSGHYMPNIKHFLQVLHQLSKMGQLNCDEVGAWDEGLGRVVDKRTVDELMIHFGLNRDFQELYDYNNLLLAYKHFLEDTEAMKRAGLVWMPAGNPPNPPGVYRLGAPGSPSNTWAWVPSREARTLINDLAVRNRAPHGKGIGISMVSTSSTNDNRWAVPR